MPGALHVTDGEMHPGQSDGDDSGKQHEAACPHADDVVHDAEAYGKHKASQSTDQADDSADRSDMLRVVDGDVLVDRRLAERHEESENDGQDHKQPERNGYVEDDGSIDASDDVIGRRVRKDESAQDACDERPIHNGAGTVFVGEPPAEGAEDAARQRVARGEQSGGRDVKIVNPDIVARQPERERNKRSEHKEVVEGEPPDLEILEGLKLLDEGCVLYAPLLSFLQREIVLRCEVEDYRRDRHDNCVDLGNSLPLIAHRGKQDWRSEIRNGGADIANAEDSQSGPLPLLGIPGRDVLNSNRKASPREPDAEGGNQKHGIRGNRREQESRESGRKHLNGQDESSTVLVRPHAEKDPAERSREDGSRDKDAKLRVVQTELGFDFDSDDREDCPNSEAHREGERARG